MRRRLRPPFLHRVPPTSALIRPMSKTWPARQRPPYRNCTHLGSGREINKALLITSKPYQDPLDGLVWDLCRIPFR